MVTTNAPLTVRDLIAALSKLPPDTPLAHWDGAVEGIYDANDEYPLKLLSTDSYDEPIEPVLCWIQWEPHIGTPLDFAPTAEPNANK